MEAILENLITVAFVSLISLQSSKDFLNDKNIRKAVACLSIFRSSISDGCQMMSCGRWSAKYVTCCPVPTTLNRSRWRMTSTVPSTPTVIPSSSRSTCRLHLIQSTMTWIYNVYNTRSDSVVWHWAGSVHTSMIANHSSSGSRVNRQQLAAKSEALPWTRSSSHYAQLHWLRLYSHSAHITISMLMICTFTFSPTKRSGPQESTQFSNIQMRCTTGCCTMASHATHPSPNLFSSVSRSLDLRRIS